jgi:hypothetical protein
VNLVASRPPASRSRPCHRAGRVRGDRAHNARHAGQREPAGPLQPQAGPRQAAPPRPWAGKRTGRRAPRPQAAAMGRISAQHCAGDFKSFSIVLIPRKECKLPKFVETCKSVQKLQTKFCMNTLEPLCTVGLTKLTFMQ